VTRVAAAVAAVAACAAIGLGIWAASLKSSLNEERSAAPRLIELSGASGTLVVTPSGKAALAVSNLRQAPAGKTYEVWVIEGKTPQRAGLMEGGTASAVKLERPVRKGAVVAVTLERDGGVDAPTSTPLFSAKV
jgi:anti-sigma-K factor RskA